jgi:hypothetical protein
VRPTSPAATAAWRFEQPGGPALGVETVGSEAFEVDARFGEASATGRRDVELEVAYLGDAAVDATVRVSTSLPAAAPWWLIPGLFYGDNRPDGCFRRYPRFEAGAHDAEDMTSCRWGFRADRAATPAVLVWGDAGGVALLADEESPAGTTGLFLSDDAAQGLASAGLCFPFVEEPVTYVGADEAVPAETATHTWRPGERLGLSVAVSPLGPDRHAYADLLREDHHRRTASAPVTPWVDVDEAAAVAAEGLYRWHFDPEPGVLLETVGFDRGVTGTNGEPVDRQAMHVGWISGIPWAAALLWHAHRVGDQRYAAAAGRVIDFVCENISHSGTFWGTWYRGKGWAQSWTPVRNGLHARTLGEATLFLLRSLAVAPEGSRDSWERAARSNLDVVVRRQSADGNLGSIHHAETGEVLSWSGAAGLTWVAALAEAGALDHDGAYLRAAERAGEYYGAFVHDELIFGAAEDVDLAPTSEDGYAAVLAYTGLYRRTGSAHWLDLARRAADWMLTFRYTYNVRFPPRTPLAVYGFATRGADQASPANQHLHAYGLICTQELVALSAALSDPFYAERAEETLACFRQMLATEDGVVNGYRGMVTERYYQTNCFQPKGMYLTLSHAWSAGVLLLACEQALAT